MNLIYLDNAATSFPKPEAVYEAVDQYQRAAGGAYGRGQHQASIDSDLIVSQCRQRIAELLNAETPDSIALTFNCTDSLNLLLRGILRRGDHVVTTTLEHNSVLRPLQQLSKELDVAVQHVAHNPQSGAVDADCVLQQVKPDTRLVVVSHASNVSGALQPIAQIAESLKSTSTAILLDAAQTVGHIPIDLQCLPVDYLAAAGHKGLLGPLGTGIIYVRPGQEKTIRPVRSGGTGRQSESLEPPVQMPTLFEAGNLNMPGIAGLNAALHDLQQQAGKDPSLLLAAELRTQLDSLERVQLQFPTATSAVPVVSFLMEGFDSRELAVVLEQSFAIQCRAGFHCAPLIHSDAAKALGGSVRLSPGRFNTPRDIQAVVEAIRQIADAT